MSTSLATFPQRIAATALLCSISTFASAAERTDPPADPPRASPATPVATVHARDRDETGRRAFPHHGTVLELTAGVAGCGGRQCGPSRMATEPGPAVLGFFGGNIHGFVELGVAASWAHLPSRLTPGTNVVAVYGLDPSRLQERMTMLRQPGPPVDELTVQQTRASTAQVGPTIRLHVRPWGRVIAWGGGGGGYRLLRGNYATDAGAVRVDLHGVDARVEAGIGVWVHRHLGLVATGSHTWTRTLLVGLDAPSHRLAVPPSALEDVAGSGPPVASTWEPGSWATSIGLRTRF